MSSLPVEGTQAPAIRTIDLNADLGEGCPNDLALLGLVSSASLCCAAHAGSPEIIRQTLLDARDLGVAVGAHPGYDDREGFGRRERKLSTAQVIDLINGQVGRLIAIAKELEMEVEYVKPHGALYNQAQWEPEIAEGIVTALGGFRIPLVGQPGSVLELKARERGLRYIAEGFPDRRYRLDGSLVPRTEPDAILHHLGEMEAQVVRLVQERRVETLCIHGDDPRAVANAQFVRLVLETQRIAVRSFIDRSI
jgi:5-oxoprolinase (ATP-hydrolysing) subunit A